MENRSTFLYQCVGDQDARGLRRSERPAHHWTCGSKPVGGSRRQIRGVITPRGDGETSREASQLVLIMLPRNTSTRVCGLSVPQTDTGRWGEYPKVLE